MTDTTDLTAEQIAALNAMAASTPQVEQTNIQPDPTATIPTPPDTGVSVQPDMPAAPATV